MSVNNRVLQFSIVFTMMMTVGLSMGFSASIAQPAPTIKVSSSSELMSALAHAKGGEVLLLQPGNYGDLVLHDQRMPFVKFSAPVTMRSGDPQRLATFTSVKLMGVENLTFEFYWISLRRSRRCR